MKGLIVLMCALVAVQARSTAISKIVRTEAALGENPWVVHLRIAVSTSGLLETCAGSLIDESWVLTAADCLAEQRFIWIRYGVVNVINPELVTENSIVRMAPVHGTVALISINRVVHSTANISPVALAAADAETPETATYCSFNDVESSGPGEILTCSELTLESADEGILADVSATVFDLGAPLVADGVQFGVLVRSVDGVTTFVRSGDFLEWIEEETGVDFSSRVAAVVASGPEAVNFVN